MINAMRGKIKPKYISNEFSERASLASLRPEQGALFGPILGPVEHFSGIPGLGLVGTFWVTRDPLISMGRKNEARASFGGTWTTAALSE